MIEIEEHTSKIGELERELAARRTAFANLLSEQKAKLQEEILQIDSELSKLGINGVPATEKKAIGRPRKA